MRTGSSPDARGTGVGDVEGGNPPWIIPGRAGNRGSSVVRRQASGVSGSSPDARGTTKSENMEAEMNRIIPGRAGNRLCITLFVLRKPDHPRTRGEQTGQWSIRAGQGESSPDARGTGPFDACRCAFRRIIPGRAGNRTERMPPKYLIQDHPRTRGEQPRGARTLDGGSGSSPDARGTGTSNLLGSSS